MLNKDACEIQHQIYILVGCGQGRVKNRSTDYSVNSVIYFLFRIGQCCL